MGKVHEHAIGGQPSLNRGTGLNRQRVPLIGALTVLARAILFGDRWVEIACERIVTPQNFLVVTNPVTIEVSPPSATRTSGWKFTRAIANARVRVVVARGGVDATKNFSIIANAIPVLIARTIATANTHDIQHIATAVTIPSGNAFARAIVSCGIRVVVARRGIGAAIDNGRTTKRASAIKRGVGFDFIGTHTEREYLIVDGA